MKSFGKTAEICLTILKHRTRLIYKELCYFILLKETFEKACLIALSLTLKQFDSKWNTHFLYAFLSYFLEMINILSHVY